MTLVDASSWIEFLRGRSSEASQRIKTLLARGHAAWCDLTLVELWNGAQGHIEKKVLGRTGSRSAALRRAAEQIEASLRSARSGIDELALGSCQMLL